MKKVISITLGGIVFAIEQDAYDVLALYLEEIKKRLSGSGDYAEIAEDIERAIAEKFFALKRDEKSAVTSGDVDVIITEMGSPADFSSETDETVNIQNKEETESTDAASDVKKHLYRDHDGAVIGGVAAGLAKYFDVDSVIIRLIFVISIFFNGLGLFVYIVLWLIVPAAETTAQKYAMRGERVTLNQITERVKKKLNNVDSEIVSDGVKSSWGGVRSILAKFFEVLGMVISAVFKALRYIFGFIFIIAGALAIAVLVFTSSILWFADGNVDRPELQPIADILLTDASGYALVLSVFIVLFIPLVVFILAGSSLLAGNNKFTLTKTITLGITWVVAVAMLAAIGLLNGSSLIKEFRGLEKTYHENNYKQELKSNNSAEEFNSTLYIEKVAEPVVEQ